LEYECRVSPECDGEALTFWTVKAGGGGEFAAENGTDGGQ